MATEFVIVRFPSSRRVNIDGVPRGTTGRVISVQPGTHRIDLGLPADYRPSRRRVRVGGTTRSAPMEVIFSPAPRRVAPRAAAPRRARKAAANAPAPAPAANARARAVAERVEFSTPSARFELPRPDDPAGFTRTFQAAAMRWTYVLRNRERWAALPATAKKHSENSLELLRTLGVGDDVLQAIATERIVEVCIPYISPDEGWEARIFPWEYIIAAATREARRGEPLTVMRRLAVPNPPPPTSAPAKVLYVESAPGRLHAEYSFDTERKLVRDHLRVKDANWKELRTPTLADLASTVASFGPDIIHLAGFDSHQGMRLWRRLVDKKQSGQESPESTAPERGSYSDGYLMAGAGGEPVPVAAERLAAALCANGHRPALVAFSLQNSAARVAAMAVAAGARAAIGFQDVIDDDAAELFFGALYRAWRTRDWQLAEGFRAAWETVREQPASMLGSGLVLWSATPLLAPTRRRAAVVRRKAEPQPQLLPSEVPPRDAPLVLSSTITPLEELNYSVLHNRCALFETFTLVNSSSKYKDSDRHATICDVEVTVTLNAGVESATYRRIVAVTGPTLDLKDFIHVPLTSELMRSVHEPIKSTLLVEVAWGKVLYRDSHLVRLLPVDQWRDNDLDGQWLPSFVLPRDPAVGQIIDKGQRYVRVLRDNPSSGFDGYQSVDPRASDPTAEVDRQVQAIWSTIVHELNLGYVNPPPSYSTAMDSQRLRTPSMVVKDRMGTCIDLALLFAACCELIDVYPVIILLKDHAFPGYWRDAAHQERFIEVTDEFAQHGATEQQDKTATPGAQTVAWWFRDTAYAEIARQVELGHLVPLESVWLTEHSGFYDAIEGGRKHLKRPTDFHSMLDIARAREAGVTPLPLGGR